MKKRYLRKGIENTLTAILFLVLILGASSDSIIMILSLLASAIVIFCILNKYGRNFQEAE